MASTLQSVRDEFGTLLVADIVLNHISTGRYAASLYLAVESCIVLFYIVLCCICSMQLAKYMKCTLFSFFSSEWVAANPNCGYNMLNSPHLKPAFVLDELLRRFSVDVANDYEGLGRFRYIRNEHDLNAVIDYIQFAVIPVGFLSVSFSGVRRIRSSLS